MIHRTQSSGHARLPGHNTQACGFRASSRPQFLPLSGSTARFSAAAPIGHHRWLLTIDSQAESRPMAETQIQAGGTVASFKITALASAPEDRAGLATQPKTNPFAGKRPGGRGQPTRASGFSTVLFSKTQPIKTISRSRCVWIK